MSIGRLAILVRGVVQGVGFRPFVYKTARAYGLSGWVRNQADQLRIEVQGTAADLDLFVASLRNEPPPQARLDAVEIVPLPYESDAGPFEIRASAAGAAPRPATPADLATCAACQAEIRNPAERRFGYPFTNCTHCGPRWSIITALPYDRPRTSMAPFVMCPACQAEYDNPDDRRFHAQPVACAACGPVLALLDAAGNSLAAGPGSLPPAIAALEEGRIVALKGLGGFQLLVDATQPAAVARLRRRKQRPDKPFALMFPTLAAIARHCHVSSAEAQALQSHQAPILLLRRREEAVQPAIAAAVAPGNIYLGAMLPYTPLHHLLMDALRRPIVCTSGNLSEEPMAITTEDAVMRLGPIADCFLVHNRPIVRPVDDSVARIGPDGLQILRRARGFAPLPLPLATAGPPILAVGGHLKNTVALAIDAQVIVSPHVGDLDSLQSVEVHRQAIADLVQFFQVTPAVVACDLHPDYASTRVAETLATEWRVPLLRVQHHHAHVAACMAEHRLSGPVLGLAWDGTGYGSDGTIWGGEFLVCQHDRFERVAHLRQFSLPGGERAMREPRRSALGLLFEIDPAEARRVAAAWFQPAELKTLLSLLARRVNSPRTSSLGRLFDALAALCGLPAVISFEGQAAMALEFAADESCTEAYCLPLAAGAPAVADWEPLVRAVLRDRAAGESAARISARFHNALADLAVAVAERGDCRQVALSGGCFQNVLLTARVAARVRQAGFEVFLHREVPPGDGGIALGQVAVAANRFRG